ncbi:Uu.00g007530.m01.CDS01 [Anthostomella pinea]|uniref:Uu.00g007530.m01.CDS01 n=1 Tax=Anthostomella pinea TaxID=933095 RepID=A0AAI8YPQ0_9PEZI|nr:Uu.00g007530.m01.CDS01 [Anthostomella pinea]
MRSFLRVSTLLLVALCVATAAQNSTATTLQAVAVPSATNGEIHESDPAVSITNLHILGPPQDDDDGEINYSTEDGGDVDLQQKKGGDAGGGHGSSSGGGHGTGGSGGKGGGGAVVIGSGSTHRSAATRRGRCALPCVLMAIGSLAVVFSAQYML